MKITPYKKIASFLFSLLIFNSTTAIIINARVLQKDLGNGTKQQVVLFGDAHLWLFLRPEDACKKIKLRDAREQKKIIEWAQKLNAQVLVEDLFDYEEVPKNLISRFLITVPHLLLQGALRISGANTYLAHLSEQCRVHNVRVVNIENRHYITSLSYALLIAQMLDVHHAGSSRNVRVADSLSLYMILASLYGIYYQYSSLDESINQSKNKEKINQYWQRCMEFYDVFSQYCSFVDAKAITVILDNPTEKTFFVCAGEAHCINIQRMLLKEGFTMKYRSFDEYCFDVLGMEVDLNNAVDIDMVIRHVG